MGFLLLRRSLAFKYENASPSYTLPDHRLISGSLRKLLGEWVPVAGARENCFKLPAFGTRIIQAHDLLAVNLIAAPFSG